LKTLEGKTIDVMVNPIPADIQKKVGYTGESTAKTISLEESHKRAVGEEIDPNSPEGRAAIHADKTGNPTIAVKNKYESYYSPEELEKIKKGEFKGKIEPPKTHGQAPTPLSDEDQTALYASDIKHGLPHTTPDSGHVVVRKKSNPKIDKIQGLAPVEATASSEDEKKYKEMLKSGKITSKSTPTNYLQKIFQHGDNENIQNYKAAPTFGKDLKKYLESTKIGDNSLADILYGHVKGTENTASMFPSFDGIKKQFESLNGISFSGLETSISGYVDKFKKSVTDVPVVKSSLETINGISYDGLKTSVTGYTKSFTDSVSNIPVVKSTLETIDGISYDGLKTSIGGYVDSFATSVSNIPVVKSTLETIDGISYEGLKTSIGGYVDSFSTSVSNIPFVKSTLETIDGISYEGLKTSIGGYVDSFSTSVSNIPIVKSTLETLNGISYEGLKESVQGYMTKFGDSVLQTPIVKSTLETLNTISYEGLKTTIQGYMTKFDESVLQNPTVKSTLEKLNDISYETLKKTIGTVITKFGDTIVESDLVKSAIEKWNSISFGGLTSTLDTLKTSLGKVITKAQEMYNSVVDYVNKSITKSNSASGTTNKTAPSNTTNVKIGTVNNTGTSVSKNAMKLVTYGGV
jgi:cobalamin biosynthesis Co2+ chelatase CbiK